MLEEHPGLQGKSTTHLAHTISEQLVHSDNGDVLIPKHVVLADASRAFATFDLEGVPPGVFDVQITNMSGCPMALTRYSEAGFPRPVGL